MVLPWLSSSFRDLSKRSHLTPIYLLFVRHVLGSLTCLVPLNFFQWLEWDAEETNVLASDGSSASLLSSLVSPFAVLEVAN